MAFGLWNTTRNQWHTMTWDRDRVPMLFDRQEIANTLATDLGASYEVREYERESN